MKSKLLLALATSLWIVGCQSQVDQSLTERGETLFREGKFDEAIAVCTQAVGENADDAAAYTIRGRAYLGKGDARKAIAEYNEAIRIAPKDAEAYYNRAVAYKELGDEKRWGEDEKLARELDPLYAQAYLFTPKDDDELASRVLAATSEVPDASTSETAETADADTAAKSTVTDEFAPPKSAAAEALSRLSSRAETSTSEAMRAAKLRADEASDSLGDPLASPFGAAESEDAADSSDLPSAKRLSQARTQIGKTQLGKTQPSKTTSKKADKYGLGEDPLSGDPSTVLAPHKQQSRTRVPSPEIPREEATLSRRQVQQNINAGEINARRLANRAYSLQSEGNTGYSASPYSGLTNSPFPQPRRTTTGVQENYGYSDYGYNDAGADPSGVGAKAGQGPLNPYGTVRRAPAYTPAVPQSNVPDYRNFTPNGPSPPLTDFYFTP